MPGSRVHKISTIFKRCQGLMKADVIQWDSRPLWYDVMEKFPPRVPPTYERAEPDVEVKKILYPDDIIRAKYYSEFTTSDVINLKMYSSDLRTKAQVFVDEYMKLQRPGATPDEIFSEVEEKLTKEGKKYVRYQAPIQTPTPVVHEDDLDLDSKK